jgi:hypothetical protein
MTLPLSTSDRNKLKGQVKKAFPDGKSDDAAVDAYALAVWLAEATVQGVDLEKYAAALDAQAKALGLKRQPGTLTSEIRAPARPAVKAVRYYRVSATHDRELPDFMPFTGHLNMVRVTLPADKPRTFKTQIGDVIPNDHLLATVAEVRSKFGGVMGPIQRVDVVTPARFGGVRFGAISVFLGYRQGETQPSFYVLEAGTATGEPKVLYEAPSFGTVLLEWAGYKPTPFASSKHIYTGKLTRTQDSPDILRITAHKNQAAAPYIKLTVKFEETRHPIAIWPGMHILQAASIVLGRHASGVR